MFNDYTVVDLTLPLGPATVMWPGAPAPQADTVVTVAHDGYFARLVHLFEHSGTHVDAPCHFIEGHGTVDKLPLQSLILSLIHISEPTRRYFPGFGVEATQFLVSERHVVGIGLDTLGIDRGVDTHFPVHSTVTLPRNVWHIENLTNLKSVPATGALVFVGVLPLVDGSGSPARVLAMVPR